MSDEDFFDEKCRMTAELMEMFQPLGMRKNNSLAHRQKRRHWRVRQRGRLLDYLKCLFQWPKRSDHRMMNWNCPVLLVRLIDQIRELRSENVQSQRPLHPKQLTSGSHRASGHCRPATRRPSRPFGMPVWHHQPCLGTGRTGS